MTHDELSPNTDKWLHPDGSVKTSAGEALLPADPDRAEEYVRRAANADKWLHPDGSVTDMSGRVILEADESRAEDYESRMAYAASPGGLFPGGSTSDPLFNITEGPADLTLIPYLPLGDRSDSFTAGSANFQLTDTANMISKGD